VASLTNANYTASNATGTLTIHGAASTSLRSITPQYDGSPEPVTATTSPAGLTAVTITYNGSSTAPTNGGSYTVVASLNHPNYTGTATGTLLVAKANQTITFGTLADKASASAPFPVSATASSGQPVSFSSQTLAQCTVSGSTVTLVGVGTCVIRASQAGTINYNPAPDVDRTFVIYKTTSSVSGRGAINSVSPAGKGSFTIAASYAKGATAPTGTNTFTVGTLSFKSTSLQWLYGSGTWVRYDGVGTLNNVAGYGFSITALSGGSSVGRFRIKIWNTATGVVAYDNQPDNQFGSPDDDPLTDPATLLTSGSNTVKN